MEFIHRLTTYSGRLDRVWVETTAAELTEEVYIELVTILAVVSVQDAFSWALGEARAPCAALPG